MNTQTNARAETLDVPVATLPPRRRVAMSSGTRSFGILAVLAAIAAWIFLLRLPEADRALLTPAVVIITIALLFVLILYWRDRTLPVFDGGILFIAATTVYSVIPLLQGWLSGMTFTPSSDLRFYTYQPTAFEYGNFAWRHVVLIGTFAFVYLLFRGRSAPAVPVRPSTATSVAVLIALLGAVAYFFALLMYMGPVVSVYEGGTGSELRSLPHIIVQITNILTLVRFTLKQCLVAVLMSRWQRLRWRLALFIWIGFEITVTVIERGARAQAALLVLTCVVLYHRLVRPLRPLHAFAGAAAILVGFMFLGLLRDAEGVTLEDKATAYSVNNEFQGLFANAYDIHYRKSQNTLPPIPPQMYWSDLYALVPSQLLPFHKIDPSNWYVDVMGAKGTGMGYMFGFIAQTSIGFDWPDIVVRAALLALFYAFLMRFYRGNASSFWATMFYLFTLTWAYYAFRSTSFDILYKIVYYFIPTFLIVTVIRLLITKPVSVARKALHH